MNWMCEKGYSVLRAKQEIRQAQEAARREKAERWRVGEGWWRVDETLHRYKCLIYSALRYVGEGWRVKSRVAFFASKTTQPTARMHLVNDRDRPDGIFLPTYYFLSANGKKLPA